MKFIKYLLRPKSTTHFPISRIKREMDPFASPVIFLNPQEKNNMTERNIWTFLDRKFFVHRRSCDSHVLCVFVTVVTCTKARLLCRCCQSFSVMLDFLFTVTWWQRGEAPTPSDFRTCEDSAFFLDPLTSPVNHEVAVDSFLVNDGPIDQSKW